MRKSGLLLSSTMSVFALCLTLSSPALADTKVLDTDGTVDHFTLTPGDLYTVAVNFTNTLGDVFSVNVAYGNGTAVQLFSTGGKPHTSASVVKSFTASAPNFNIFFSNVAAYTTSTVSFSSATITGPTGSIQGGVAAVPGPIAGVGLSGLVALGLLFGFYRRSATSLRG